MPGAEVEPAFDSAKDEAELAVVDAADEDDSGVRPAAFCPLTKDLGEVGNIVRDEDPPVFRCHCENVLVVESLEIGLLIERTHECKT